MRTTKVTSLPPKLLREVIDSRWRDLRKFGRSRARRLGIAESDVERLVAEYRAER